MYNNFQQVSDAIIELQARVRKLEGGESATPEKQTVNKSASLAEAIAARKAAKK